MKKLIHKHATIGDLDTVYEKGITWLELDYTNEAQRKIFEYYAVCETDEQKNFIDTMNFEIAVRPSPGGFES